MPPKVVVTRDFGPEVMPMLQGVEVVLWTENKDTPREWLLENVKGAGGVLCLLSDKIDDEFLDAAGPGLKVVSTMSVGYDHIDIKALTKRGVRIGYTPDVLTDAVADVTVMLALMASRNGGQTADIVSDGRWSSFTWSPYLFCGQQLSTVQIPALVESSIVPPSAARKVAGFLGFGRIAQATLKRLAPFGITECIWVGNPSSKVSSDEESRDMFGVPTRRVDLSTLAKESDVLFVLAPSSPSTYHIVNEDLLKQMKPTAVLVNTARGTLVDSAALAKAVRERWIWGAGLDVVEGEPNINGRSGSDANELVKEPRIVVLPHIGSATHETRIGMARMAVANLLGGLGVRKEGMAAELNFKAELS